MARSTGNTQAQAASPAPLDVNAIRAERDKLDAQLKALREVTEGKISGIAVEGGVVQVDVQMGNRERKTKDGRRYLFNAEAVTFTTPDGVKWQTGAFFATEVVPKAAK